MPKPMQNRAANRPGDGATGPDGYSGDSSGDFHTAFSDDSPGGTPGGSAHEPPLRLPSWLRRPLPTGRGFVETRSLIGDLGLSTVCQGAKCPNIHECFSCGTATFLILGSVCTRNCAFCNIDPGSPPLPEPDEPRRVAEAARRLGLQHVVVTSVTRDDLEDGGAAHFAATIRAVREVLPQSSVEVLIPDFKGSRSALETVMREKPEVINHNVETHRSLYDRIRPQADYGQSLELLRRASEQSITAKSGFMVGLGETDDDVREVLSDLHAVGCAIVTIGQYMRPSLRHPAVQRYVSPERFEQYARWGADIGIAQVFSAPIVRSSYHAGSILKVIS